MEKHPEEALSDIRRMMERSSRFHSLSGFSMVAAGICGLLGIVWVKFLILPAAGPGHPVMPVEDVLRDRLIVAALSVLVAAVGSGFFFTRLKIREKGLPLWDAVFRKVTVSFLIPMITGGALVLGMVFYGEYHFIAAVCLLFYGLALVNAAHNTLNEIRFLGMFEILAGIFCLFSGYKLLSLALGFGVLNILYGLIIWYRYKEGVSIKK